MVNAYLQFLDHHHTAIIHILEVIGIAASRGAATKGILATGETINEGWDQADKAKETYDDVQKLHQEVNDTIEHAKSTYPSGSRGMQDIKKKVALINSTVEQHNISTMSNKSRKTSGGTFLGLGPSSTPRQTPVLTHTSHAKAGKREERNRQAEGYSIKSPQTPVTSSALTTNLKYFDSHLIEGPSEKNLTALNVKIGKQLYPDVITPFLKNLSGHGKIRMQFAGRCICAKDARHTHVQIFRHRLSTGTDFTGAAWPTGTPGTADYILGPQNTAPFKVDGGGDATVNATFPVASTSFRDIINKSTYWAPYNKADLEDLSWNLNSLKLNNNLWLPATPQTSGVGFETNVALFQPNMHARQSAIAQNNREAVVLPPSSTTRTGSYRYNAVFNKGSIEYDFMNKGTGGAKIELIVYRRKKKDADAENGPGYANSPTRIFDKIAAAVGAGYLETCVEKGGTDALLGRPPLAADVSANPAFPFLPTLKKTVGMDMHFVEISRQTFAMPSGSRRSVTIILPGSVYDPVNEQNYSGATYPTIVDNGAYVICMSVSGVKCTNEVSVGGNVPGAPRGDYNIGDMFAAANIQFYGTYTEHMGACQYKVENAANIYTQGALLQTAAPTNYVFTPVTMLPAESAVRVGQPPGGTSGGYGGQSNLGHAFSAEPL